MDKIEYLYLGIFVLGIGGVIILSFQFFVEEQPRKIDPYDIFTVCHPVENNVISIYHKKDAITWTSNYCLVWDDFEGDIDYGKNKTAWTTWDFDTTFDVEVIDNETREYQFTNIDIVTFFIKSKSWVDLEKLQSGDIKLLRHEQGHFDLAEMHSRAIEEIMKEELMGKIFIYDDKEGHPEQLAKSNGKSKINEIFSRFPKSQSVSDNYDRITESGINWDRQIDYNLSFDKLRDES